MGKIIVFDVAASSGGALSVLNDFYEEYKKDFENEYIFVISTPKLEETANIQVLRYPWIKKSWLHRLFFDYFIAPKLVRKKHVDQVFSLQNIIIPNIKHFQTVYVHNSLPFTEYRFGLFEDTLLWIYQNIISVFIFQSIKKANRVIVQADWMKELCIKRLNVAADKIDVWPPKIEINIRKNFSRDYMKNVLFFYPASAVKFKNHDLIIQASNTLKENGIENYRVVFTLTGNENQYIRRLYDTVKSSNLPIEFIGSISRAEVYDYYSRSILLFPSYIESSPLPLKEAKLHGSPIIVSDFAYSREALLDYSQVHFIDAFDSNNLAFKMQEYILK